MLQHINLSTDVVILGSFAFLGLVGVALGVDRLRAFALSIYVGLVLAYELGGPVGDFLTQHGTNLTPGRVRLILFTLPILVLSLTHHGKSKRHSSTIVALVLALLLAALIIASVFHLMDADEAAKLLGNSSLAWPILNLRLVWLGAIPIVVVAGAFMKSKK